MNNKAISIGITQFCSIFILWFNVIVPKLIHKRFAKDPYEAKYQYLIKIREKVGIDHHNDPRAYIEYSNDMRDVYKISIITILMKKINISSF